MSEESVNTMSCFQKLLVKFLTEDHQVIDDTCLEKLLTHLSQKENEHLLLLPECRTFCEQTLQAYEKGAVSESLLSFALRLHGQVIGSEAIFASTDIQEATKNVALSPRLLLTGNASIQCAFVQMASALLQHKTGTDWLVKTDTWKKIKSLYDKNHSIYVTRECQKFLSSFSMKVGPSQMDITQDVLKSHLHSITTDSNESVTLHLSLDLIIAVLEESFRANRQDLAKLVEPQLHGACKKWLSTLKDTAQLGRVAKLQVLLKFALTEASEKDLTMLEESILSVVSNLIDMKNVLVVYMTLLQCQLYWSILRPRVGDVTTEFQLDHQLIYIQVLPLLQKDFNNFKEYCVRHFLETLSRLASNSAQMQGCRLRRLVMASEEPQRMACRGIHTLMQMKDAIPRESAVFIFRTLMCILIQFIEGSSEEIEEAQVSGLLGTTLESIVVLIDHFHFTWRESIETICLTSYMQELLCEPALAQRHVSQVLRVTRRGIAGFMPPNLALLMNTLDNSPLQSLGPQLYRSLHAITWEVRDSALEVLATIAQIAQDKFPAFQEHLLQHKLCPLAVSMAAGDEESYVRVSALISLTRMVAVDSFWAQCLVHERLPQAATSILCHESEGIVRKEAAALATVMLQHKRFTPEERERMNLVMASVAVNDLHWEVKTNALEYWEVSIEQHTSEEGMLDGKFPAVTFSGPSRKIVTLDAREVKERLRRVLEQLSRSRCLAVLLSALQDPDLQVARHAVRVLKALQQLLQENGLFDNSIKDVESTKAKEVRVANSPAVSTENGGSSVPRSDEVIDGIVGQSDLALLATVCRSQLSLQEEALDHEPPSSVQQVGTTEFLKAIVGVELEGLIDARAAWIDHCSEHLESLLTDMLEAREFQHHTNDMDCY